MNLEYKIILSIFFVFNASSIKCESPGRVVDTAVKLARVNFYPFKKTIVTWSSGNEDAVFDFLKSFNFSVVLVSHNTNIRQMDGEQFIIIINEAEEFNDFLKMIKDDQVPPIKVLVAFLKSDYVPDDMLQLMRGSFINNITDILILTNRRNGTIETTTYFPNTSGSCGNHIPVTRHGPDMFCTFPLKYNNFNGCPLTMSVIHHPPFNNVKTKNGAITSVRGIEGRLVDLIVKHLNASLKCIFPINMVFGSIINGTWVGSVGDLFHGRADISATSAILTHERYTAVQMTHCYKALDLKWFGPKQREIHEWAKVLLPMLTDVTLLFCISCILFLIVSNIARKVNRHTLKNKTNVTLFNAWGMFMGQYINLETTSLIMNGLYAQWLGYCLILRIAYQGELMKDLHKQILEPPINTLNEAVEKLHGVGCLVTLLSFVEEPLAKKYFTTLNITTLLNWVQRISKGEQMLVGLDTMTVFQYGVGEDLRALPESLVTAPVGILSRRRWSGLEAIDILTMRIVESGLFGKIEHDYKTRHLLMASKKMKTALIYKPLEWYTLSACFYGLFIEWILCLLVLLLEIIWFKVQPNRFFGLYWRRIKFRICRKLNVYE